MALDKAQRRKPGIPFSALLYGVSAVILATVGYTLLGILPALSRTVQLVRQVAAEDLSHLRVEGDLHMRLARNRTALLAFLANPKESQALAGLRASDAEVAAAAARFTAVSGGAQLQQSAYVQAWQRYLGERNELLAIVSRSGVAAALARNPNLGETSYRAAQDAVRSAEFLQESAAVRHVATIASVLGQAQRGLLLLIAIEIAGLSMIGWLDWRRHKVEALLQRAKHALEEQEKSFQHAFDSATVGMGIFKLDGTVVSVNRKGAALLGYKPEELIGTKVAAVIAPEHRDNHLDSISAAGASAGATYVAERRVLRKDGSAAWVRNSVTRIQPEAREGYFFSISEEITAQKEAYDRLEWLANYDLVTALPNRRFFEEEMIRMLAAEAEGAASIALLYIEIDGFEFLKGTFGRGAADEVLSELAAELRSVVSEPEQVGRLDDYAFGMLMPSAAYEGSVVKRAEELLDLFRRLPETGAQRIPLSASIGVVYADESVLQASQRALGDREQTDSGAETMLKLARAAMLEARARGGDVVQVADPALQERALQRNRIETALLRGIHRDELRVVFQPQFRIADGALVRFEALCRWDSSELGPIPPDRFIPIAEESGLMTEIGRRVMVDALRQARRWTDTGRKIGISVNISPVQFMRPDFTGLLSEALVATGFPPALLELEITEGIFIRDLNLAVARIRDLQRLGVSVALDDFGTGYSSLSYLQRMPIDAVKLDRSFVSELTADASTVSMMRSVVTMAHALELRVVTEGVETREQLEILRELGCDEAQGFFLGRPEEAEVAYQRVMDSPRMTIGIYA